MFRKAVCVVLGGLCVVAAWRVVAQGDGKKPQLQAAQPSGPKHDFGFSAAFEEEVKKIGQISPDQFAERFAEKAKYLAKINWDPTTAKFWDRFTLDPNDPKAMTPIRNIGQQQAAHLYDFRLNDQELAVLKDKGFVVSERRGSHSFTDLYYRLYVRDLPVFITSDSMLHAWHRYFDRMLESLENDYFRPAFKQMLGAMAKEIPAAQKEYGDGPLAEAVRDVDFFLAVARNLLESINTSPTRERGSSFLGQDDRVNAALSQCFAEKMVEYPLFGRLRPIDFSQFKPRGRYDQNQDAQRYFRAVMWLGRIDFRIAGGESAEQDLRELSGAIVLNDLLQRAKMKDRW
ncbi:MAG: DUF3160 domain-containing protein, partial [Gemmataceae bacterium]|nr:DUF3160 domain-containing protein [Gemmataceae bacterium]